MSDITPEQRAAWKRLSNAPDSPRVPEAKVEDDAALIAPLLPIELTDPQPELPSKPGRYESHAGDSAWLLDAHGKWSYDGDESGPATEPEQYAPFTRLVPERPAITRGQILTRIGYGMFSDADLVELLDLVNGPDRD